MSLRWVSSRLSDGLGNRLFQLAAAHRQAKLWKMPLVFAMPYCTPGSHGSYSSIFRLFPAVEKVWKAEPAICINQEPGEVFVFNPLPEFPPTDTVLLRGSWISAKYVDHKFKPDWSKAVEGPATLLARWGLSTPEERSRAVFIHVRLGDYTILPHHQVNLLSYYVRAMASFPEDTRFLVFSDEPKKAKMLPVFEESCTFVDEPDELASMFLMANCARGAITANSTFSWWGAFFGRQNAGPQHKTVMPSRWMASGENTSDVYPEWAVIMDI